MERKATSHLLDINSWEITGSVYEGDRIVRGKSVEKLKNTVEINAKEDYVKVFVKPAFEMARCLTGTETQFVNFLMPYISYDSGMLTKANGRPLTRAQIAVETGLALKTVDRLLLSLRQKQVLSKNKMGRQIQFFMNPWLFMRGKRINKTLYEMFRGSRWAKLYDADSRFERG